jgi:hypothetical protein
MSIANMAIGFKGFGREAASDMNRARNALSGCLLVVTIRHERQCETWREFKET